MILSYSRGDSMTLKEAAKDATVTYQTVLRWVKMGLLETKNIGLKRTYIEPEEWRRNLHKQGSPA